MATYEMAVTGVCQSLHWEIYGRSMSRSSLVKITDMPGSKGFVVNADALPFTFRIEKAHLHPLRNVIVTPSIVEIRDENSEYVGLTLEMLAGYKKRYGSSHEIPIDVACYCSDCNTSIDCKQVATESRTYLDYVENMKAKRQHQRQELGA
jgi:hypothetical protein